MIKNIWKDIEAINNEYYNEADTKIKNLGKIFDLEKVPEPRLGNIYSKIIVLSGNPNIKGDSPIKPEECLASLRNHNSKHLCLSHSKDDWWQKRFSDWVSILINHNKANHENEAYNLLAENICSLEYYPYSSKKFPQSDIILKSNCYIKEIVENAMEKKASIIITRDGLT